MGLYINPIDQSKEEWLQLHGEQTEKPVWFGDGEQFPVCLVDNGPFTAAGVCFSPQELYAFMTGTTDRPTKWYICKKDDINAVTDGGLDHYLR